MFLGKAKSQPADSGAHKMCFIWVGSDIRKWLERLARNQHYSLLWTLMNYSLKLHNIGQIFAGEWATIFQVEHMVRWLFIEMPFSLKRLFIKAPFHQSPFSSNLVKIVSFIEWMNDYIQWSGSGFSLSGSVIKSTIKHAPLSQLPTRASRSVLGLLVWELWLIQVSPAHLAWRQGWLLQETPGSAIATHTQQPYISPSSDNVWQVWKLIHHLPANHNLSSDNVWQASLLPVAWHTPRARSL